MTITNVASGQNAPLCSPFRGRAALGRLPANADDDDEFKKAPSNRLPSASSFIGQLERAAETQVFISARASGCNQRESRRRSAALCRAVAIKWPGKQTSSLQSARVFVPTQLAVFVLSPAHRQLISSRAQLCNHLREFIAHWRHCSTKTIEFAAGGRRRRQTTTRMARDRVERTLDAGTIGEVEKANARLLAAQNKELCNIAAVLHLCHVRRLATALEWAEIYAKLHRSERADTHTHATSGRFVWPASQSGGASTGRPIDR